MDNKKRFVICASLAVSAIESMASAQSSWSLDDLKKSEDTKTKAVANHLIQTQNAMQAMGHHWYDLAKNTTMDGKSFTELYQEEGVELFQEIQSQGASVMAGSCYAACYGNCYANCYQNCYNNCHGADS